VQHVDAGPVDRDLVLRRKFKPARDGSRIIGRQFAVGHLAAKRNLHAIESQLRRQRDRLRIRAELQVPVGHADAEPRARRPKQPGKAAHKDPPSNLHTRPRSYRL